MNNLPHGASAVRFWSRVLLVWGIMSEGLVSVARRGYSDDCSDDDNYGGVRQLVGVGARKRQRVSSF